MGRIVIVVGDGTSSGGTVLTGSPFTEINGMAIARIGDKAYCPKHSGAFPIITGDPTFCVDGQPLARHGDYLACGCQLVGGKQSTVTVEGGGSGKAKSSSAAPSSAAGPAPAAAVALGPPMSLLDKKPVCEECLMAAQRSGSVFMSR